MRRRRNISLADYNSASYPLNVAARALNYSYAKERRVVNPKRAHLLVASAPFSAPSSAPFSPPASPLSFTAPTLPAARRSPRRPRLPSRLPSRLRG